MQDRTPQDNRIKVLLELRPALEGYAGIPQEVRLLFRALRNVRSVDVEGLLLTSHRRLAKGTRNAGVLGTMWKRPSVARRYRKYSNVVISMVERPHLNTLELILNYLLARCESVTLQIRLFLGIDKIKLTRFESNSFEDFIWRTLFAKTLPASDFSLITSANHRICPVSWNTLHDIGLASRNWRTKPKYSRIETRGIDIFIGQTPFPGRVDSNTAMVIRYHDAIPIFMPHTIPEKARHQAIHFFALMDNVINRAWFACVSEATRQDLVKLFPEASDRAVTIYNMISPHYFPAESKADRVPQIVWSRLYEESGFLPKFFSLREKEKFYERRLFVDHFRYVLIVSTIEPRKNHTRLLAAWEIIKSDVDPDLKMVVVGTLGWDNSTFTSAIKPWIDRGDAFMLNAVPAPELRVLYRHAGATVCPSLGEGFDFSGVESMRCGGVTIASDIRVHREVYGSAAEYFDPYSTMSLVSVLKKVLSEEAAPNVRQTRRQHGLEVSARYLPERIIPQWEEFLKRVMAGTT